MKVATSNLIKMSHPQLVISMESARIIVVDRFRQQIIQQRLIGFLPLVYLEGSGQCLEG